MLAYILIQLKKAHEKSFFHELGKMDNVKDVNLLFGEWDIIAKVEFPDPEQIAKFMLDVVRQREDVKQTKTLIVAK